MFNDYLDATMGGVFLILVLIIVVEAVRSWFGKPQSGAVSTGPGRAYDRNEHRRRGRIQATT